MSKRLFPLIDLAYILQNDPYSTVALVFWINWSMFMLLSFWLFVQNRHKAVISGRSPWLLTHSAVGQYLVCTSFSWKIIVTPENYPNFLDHWMLWFMIPLNVLPYPLRSVRFNLLYKLSLEDDPHTDRNKSLMRYLRNHFGLVTDRAFCIYLWLMMVPIVGMGFVTYIAHEENHIGQWGYQNEEMLFESLQVLFVLVAVVIGASAVFVKEIHDELAMSKELVTVDILWFVFFVPYLLFGFFQWEPRQIPLIFGICLCVSTFVVSLGMPIQWARVKPEDVKLGTDVLDKLELLMKDNSASNLLYDFMLKQLCQENFLFIREVEEYKKLTDQGAIERAYTDICQKYIDPSARMHVNISYKMAKDILSFEGHPGTDSFNRPYEEIVKLIKTGILPMFRQSDAAIGYAKYLKRRGLAQIMI